MFIRVVGEDGATHPRKAGLRYPSATQSADENGSRERLATDSSVASGARDRSPSLAHETGSDMIEMAALPAPGKDYKPGADPETSSSSELKNMRKDAQVVDAESCIAQTRVFVAPIAPIGTASNQQQSGSLSFAEGELNQRDGAGAEDASEAHDESWHVLGNFISVLSGLLYVIASVVVFCVYLVPLFSLYATNNQLNSYISR